MKGRIPGSKVEEVKDRADIVDLISEYVTLKKAGRNFIGLCPFHKEKTPSFTVNRDKQIFYCFGCGEGGNVYSFLMKITHQSFPEAVRYLARKTGIVIPEGAITREEKERIGVREQIIRVNQMAAGHFSQNLFSHAGREAREYLKKRGFGESVTREFHLGYALDEWRNLRDYFEKGKIPFKLAEQAGLIISKADGKNSYYDRFRGRLIFPIEDIGGHTVAFGGRTIGNGEPKYLNSPESPVYIKGRCLYGLNKTKDDIRKIGCVILVEGYFDFLSLWNAGVTNVVATLGTALTKEHVDLIKRYTNQVVAVFDPDEAGKKALARSLEFFLAGNIHAKVVVLPEGYDPDLYIRTFGREPFEGIVTQAQSMVDYYIEKVLGKVDTLEEKRDTLKESVPFIIHIDNAGERDLFIKRISERLGLNQELLIKEVNRCLPPSKRTSKKDSPVIQDASKIDGVELSLIYIMLEYPHKIQEIVHTGILSHLTNSDLKTFGGLLKEFFDRDGLEGFDSSLLIDRLDNKMIREILLKKMVDEAPYDEKMADHILGDAIRQIKRKLYKENQRVLKIKLVKAQEMGDHELCNTLLADIQRLQREKEALST
ncbi:MAG: DNA primase [Deltaproteobacteria bacterium]|nr:DNA primase [Deltaproteobacteria bacterium]